MAILFYGTNKDKKRRKNRMAIKNKAEVVILT